MELKIIVSLLNAIEYIQELTNYDFDYIAKEILGIDIATLKTLKKYLQ
jgi:hypothetical protein